MLAEVRQIAGVVTASELTCPSLLRETISAVASSCKIKARKHCRAQKNFRVYFILTILVIFGVAFCCASTGLRSAARAAPECLREHGGREHNGCGPHRLRAMAKIYAGPALGEILEHPKRHEVWGSAAAGARVVYRHAQQSNHGGVFAVADSLTPSSFPPRVIVAYTTASGADQLIAIDCAPAPSSPEPKPARNLFRCASLPTTNFCWSSIPAQGRSAFTMPPPCNNALRFRHSQSR